MASLIFDSFKTSASNNRSKDETEVSFSYSLVFCLFNQKSKKKDYEDQELFSRYLTPRSSDFVGSPPNM